jgi:prolyl-tRNA synthetase
MEETLRMLEVYRAFAEEDLAIPVVSGLKTESEKFAGAEKTYSIEALMKDGRALQSGTSHYLGTHFAKVFNITYQDEEGERQFVHQTSWGVSTRMVGALIMAQGDDTGLRLPPRVAPHQVIVVPIYRKEGEREQVSVFVDRIRQELRAAGVRHRVDDDDSQTPGFKFNKWERRGVPVRFEVGPRDVKSNQVLAARRDTGEKTPISMEELAQGTQRLLEDVQQNLLAQARAYRDQNTHAVESFDELATRLEEARGFIRARWCGSPDCETKVKERTTATIRCLPFGEPDDAGACVACGQPAPRRALFAKAY